MKKIFYLLAFTATLGMLSCSNNSKTENQDTENQAETQKLTDGNYSVDTAASKMMWKAEALTGGHEGTIEIKDGSLTVANGVLSDAKFTINMNTINPTDLEDAEKKGKLIGHLSGNVDADEDGKVDFFGTDSFPTASFVMTSADSTNLTGNLTIKGISNSITVPYTVSEEEGKIMANANFKVDRTDFGINFRSTKFFDNIKDKAISDEFELNVQIVAKK